MSEGLGVLGVYLGACGEKDHRADWPRVAERGPGRCREAPSQTKKLLGNCMHPAFFMHRQRGGC